jgi:hypothetical protein
MLVLACPGNDTAAAAMAIPLSIRRRETSVVIGYPSLLESKDNPSIICKQP